MQGLATRDRVNEAVGRSRACYADQSKLWAADEAQVRGCDTLASRVWRLRHARCAASRRGVADVQRSAAAVAGRTRLRLVRRGRFPLRGGRGDRG